MKRKSLILVLLALFVASITTSGLSALPKDMFRALNGQLFYDDICTSSPATGGNTTVMLAGNNNVEKLLNYLQSKGFTLEQASGAVGNAMWESGSIELNPEGTDGVAFGIMQWQSRFPNLVKHAGGGDNWKNFDIQVEYIGVELGWEQAKNGAVAGGEAATVPAMKATSTPEQAALVWEKIYERSADTVGSIGWKTRQEYARMVYETYKNGPSAGSGNAQSLAANTGDGCTSSGAAGKVNADGYAWPIALNQQEVDGNWPCPSSCHHDGTAAFDLARKAQNDTTENVPVIAIVNGTIERFNPAYKNIQGKPMPGCHAFQLVGDDGWWYWYGHLQASTVQDGSKVTAGQQISTVGRRECTGNRSYPHLHIDRGAPKGSYGGDKCCRDPDFTSLMNQLHSELGGGVLPRDL